MPDFLVHDRDTGITWGPMSEPEAHAVRDVILERGHLVTMIRAEDHGIAIVPRRRPG